MLVLKGISESWFFVWVRPVTDSANPKLEVYPIVILQLTTLSLLFSLSTSAAGLVPALVSGGTTPVAQNETLGSNLLPKKEVRVEDYQPITDSENVQRYVEDYFTDIPILAYVAGCESHYRQLNSSGNILRGKKNIYDVGVMQINELYHAEDAQKLGLDIYTLEGNVAFARHLYEKYGAKPWMASSACWAKFTESEIARR